MYNIIIIGGMAAGCKAAARLSRLSSNYKITIIERNPFISVSNCGLPFFAAGEIDSIFDLLKTSYGIVRDVNFFREFKNVKVLTKTEVEKIDTSKNKVICKDLDKIETIELSYDYLVITTGAEKIKPNFPYPSSPFVSSFQSFTDAKTFRQFVQSGKINKAVIIGGGFIGCEMIEALNSLWGIDTVLIEKEESLLPGCLDLEISRLIESKICSDKIQLLLSTVVERIELNEKEQPVVILENMRKIECDYVFYCLGVRPNSKLAETININIGKHGGIIVDEQMRTNIPNIWAAGDCVEIENLVTSQHDYFSLGSLSNRMGKVAADSIAGKHSAFKGAAGTISLKLFDDIICASGLTEKKAHKLGYETGSVIGYWTDRPDYYPEAKNLLGKLIYEKPGLRLLGLQLAGEGEVTRYIDVFSKLLARKETLEDLVNLEHGYTPAHSSPLSPLNYLGFMAINQEQDGIKNVNPLEFSSFDGTIIDVRETQEVESVPFPEKSIQIPLSNLRNKLNDFDLDEPIMFVCEKGLRAYEAARIFINHGFKNVSYLGAGNLLFNEINKFSKMAETL